MVSNRKTIKRQTVAVHADVVAQFSEVCERPVGRSMNDALTRILQWFNRQEPYVQTAVTSDVDRGMEQHYAAALRQLADELDKPLSEPPPIIPPGAKLADGPVPDVPPNPKPDAGGKGRGKG